MKKCSIPCSRLFSSDVSRDNRKVSPGHPWQLSTYLRVSFRIGLKYKTNTTTAKLICRLRCQKTGRKETFWPVRLNKQLHKKGFLVCIYCCFPELQLDRKARAIHCQRRCQPTVCFTLQDAWIIAWHAGEDDGPSSPVLAGGHAVSSSAPPSHDLLRGTRGRWRAGHTASLQVHNIM